MASAAVLAATTANTDAIVYSAPDCSQCDATKRRLTQKGLTYSEVLLAEEPELLEKFKAAGFRMAPIVETRTALGTWSGLRPDLINKLAKILNEDQAAAPAAA